MTQLFRADTYEEGFYRQEQSEGFSSSHLFATQQKLLSQALRLLTPFRVVLSLTYEFASPAIITHLQLIHG